MRHKALLFFAVAVFIGCGASQDRENKFLSVGTAPPGGAFFVVGGAIAQVVNDHMPWEVSAEATKGTQENIRRLSSGELDFALANCQWFGRSQGQARCRWASGCGF